MMRAATIADTRTICTRLDQLSGSSDTFYMRS